MKKKVIVSSLLAILIMLVATSAFCIDYTGGATYSFNTGSLSYTTGDIGHNHCTTCQVDIYGTTYQDTEESYLLTSGGTKESKTKLVTAGGNADYTAQASGSLRLHIVNHDYYGQYEMYAAGTYTL